MAQTFQVGGTYQNRLGEYKVIEVADEKLLARYETGEERWLTIATQKRIVRNMALDEKIQESEVSSSRSGSRRRGASSSRSGSRKRGSDFEGLHENDFQRGTTGTHWRARTSLGGALAAALSRRTGDPWQSWAIFRRAEVYVAREDAFDDQNKRRMAKLMLAMDPEGATFGFYVEKNRGPIDDTWDWLRFVDHVSDVEAQQQLAEVMRERDLQWRLAVGEEDISERLTPAEDGVLLRKTPAGQEETETWDGFAQRLASWPEDEWLNVYLAHRLERMEAMELEERVADSIVQVFASLVPLYEAVVS